MKPELEAFEINNLAGGRTLVTNGPTMLIQRR
jgi:hypothetical protein